MEEPVATTAKDEEQSADGWFAAFLVGMEPRLRRYMGRLCRSSRDDLVQEALARAWRFRAQVDAGRGHPESWLMKLGFGVFLDSRRPRTGPRTVALDGPTEIAACGPSPAQAAEDREWNLALLDALSEVEREVLLGFHARGLSVEALARDFGLPTGTVKSHLHRARARMWAMQQREDQR